MKHKKPSTAEGEALPLPRGIGRLNVAADSGPSRVERIRQAIAEGRFDVSAEAIAEQLLARGHRSPAVPPPLVRRGARVVKH
jgi:hypothetical protein